MVGRIKRRLREGARALARLRKQRKARAHEVKVGLREREQVNERRRRLREIIERLIRAQDRHIRELGKPDPEIRDKLKERRAELELLTERKRGLTKRINHFRRRVQARLKRIRWWVAKRTWLRKKLREARRDRDPRPASWQANGHEWWNLTDRARKLLAIAVVKYDLACTSITRDWGTGSLHEQVPTRGFDCAGARMADFQRDLRYGRIKGYQLNDLLELIGPDNAAWANDGQPWSGAEGSALETQHDNHTHAFVY